MLISVGAPIKGRTQKHGHAHRIPSVQGRGHWSGGLGGGNVLMVRSVRKHGNAKAKDKIGVHARRTKVRAMLQWEDDKKHHRRIIKKIKFRLLARLYLQKLHEVTPTNPPHSICKLKWSPSVEVLPFNAESSPSSIHTSTLHFSPISL